MFTKIQVHLKWVHKVQTQIEAMFMFTSNHDDTVLLNAELYKSIDFFFFN